MLKIKIHSHQTLKEAWKEACADGSYEGSYPTFCRHVKRDVSPAELALSRHGVRAYEELRLRLVRTEGTKVNERCIDAHQLPILVALNGRSVKPSVVIVEDPASRAIAAVVLTTDKANSGDALIAICEAIRHGKDYTPVYGKFAFMRKDNGGEFASHAITEQGLELGYAHVAIMPRKPQQNGKLERFNRTLDAELIAKLPWYTKGPQNADGTPMMAPDTPMLTPEALWREIIEYLRYYNFERKHSALVNRTPAQVWDEDFTFVDQADEDLLRRYSLEPAGRGGVRTVEKRGVMYNRAYYTHVDLNQLIGEGVEIRIRRYDERMVAVYQNDVFICEAWNNKLGSEADRQYLAATTNSRQREYERRALEGRKLLRDRHVDKQRYSSIARDGDRVEPVTVRERERRGPAKDRGEELLGSGNKSGTRWTVGPSEDDGRKGDEAAPTTGSLNGGKQ